MSVVRSDPDQSVDGVKWSRFVVSWSWRDADSDPDSDPAAKSMLFQAPAASGEADPFSGVPFLYVTHCAFFW